MKSSSRLMTIHLTLLGLLGLAACGGSTAIDNADSRPSAGGVIEEPAPASAPPEDANPPEPKEPATADQTIIPGERVGPVTATTSREALVEIYGEDQLADQAIPMGEGTTEPGTMVNLGPDRQFAIVWRDDSQSAPLLAKNFGPAWQTPEGLGVGAPYATVQSVLGDFKLYGFAWDYEGSLVLEGSNLDKYYGDLLLRVRPSQESVAAHPKAYQAVMGDALYSGDDPNLEPLDLRVYEMTVYLNPLTEE